MQINWSAQEVVLRLTPVGRPLGRNTLEASVFAGYSDDVKTRFVQELCGLVGGDVVYLESADAEGRPYQTVPVSNWRHPMCRASMPYAADFANAVFGNNLKLVVYGSDRARWELSVKERNGVVEALDNQTDRGSAGVTARCGCVEANGIRTNF